MKTISAILPCYNVENYIDRVLTSLIDQTIDIDALEIICVNDCSTDNTLSLLKSWEQKYPQTILVINLEVNSRQGAARNIGLNYSTGNYVAFIDSDDWIEKDYLEKLYSISKHGNYDIVQCDYIRDYSTELSYLNSSDKKETGFEELIVSDNSDRKKFLVQKHINNLPHCKLIKKDFLVNNSITFTEGLAYEDSFWGVLINMYFTRAYIVHEQLYHYFVNNVSTSLSTNELYHVDLLTNQIALWNELKKRGFMKEYKEEIEIEFVYSCAMIFWKMIILRYDIPPYPLYRLLCAVVQEHIPDIMSNSHIIKNEVAEIHLLLLKSCLHVLNKKEFLDFAENVKKIGL